MLPSCEICQIFSPTSTVLGELQDTKAGQELRAIKTAFERDRDVMQVSYL
jgi:hypothetical protein